MEDIRYTFKGGWSDGVGEGAYPPSLKHTFYNGNIALNATISWINETLTLFLYTLDV